MNGPRDYAPPHIRAIDRDTMNVDLPLPRSLQRAARTDGVSQDTLDTLADEVKRAGALNTSLQERQHPDGGPQGWARHPAIDAPSMARAPTLLENLAEILCRLPFGDMMELAAGVAAAPAAGSSTLPSNEAAMQLANQIHAWARKTYDAR